MNKNIVNILAREVLDSRGFPTVEVEVILADGSMGRASVPSGASKGEFEAIELRDNDNSRYNGKGVEKSVNFINKEIIPAFVNNINPFQQEIVDKTLIDIDGTENKSRIGANTTLAVSLAVAKAAANSVKLPLYQYLGGIQARVMPVPLINIINGGMHADNLLDFQEFMIAPVKGDSFRNALQISAEVFYALKKILKKKRHNTNVGDEGGFAPNFTKTREALDNIMEAIECAGYSLNDVKIALDIASSTFYKNNTYNFDAVNLNASELVDYYADLIQDYPIISLEDACAENDENGWILLTEKLGNKVQLVGDDLFVTNCKLIKQGIEKKMANSVLIKLNQIGTLTETFDAIRLAQLHGYKVIISHRSGETEDCTIAHIAVATNCGQIKTGSLSRSERVAKYNELLRIEEHLGSSAKYNGII